MNYLFTNAPLFIPTMNMREFEIHDLEHRVAEVERKERAIEHVEWVRWGIEIESLICGRIGWCEWYQLSCLNVWSIFLRALTFLNTADVMRNPPSDWFMISDVPFLQDSCKANPIHSFVDRLSSAGGGTAARCLYFALPTLSFTTTHHQTNTKVASSIKAKHIDYKNFKTSKKPSIPTNNVLLINTLYVPWPSL